MKEALRIYNIFHFYTVPNFFFSLPEKKKIRQWTDLSDTFVGRFSLFLFFFYYVA